MLHREEGGFGEGDREERNFIALLRWRNRVECTPRDRTKDR